jgi:multicomponent Na+:H+ antiporter subunit F
MDTVYLIVLAILLISGLFSIIRAGIGPTSMDRMMAVNTFTTKSILIIAVYLFSTGHPEFIDIALLYALIGYVGTLALVNYFKREWSDGND